MIVVAQMAHGTGRLEGPLCTKEHEWLHPTPGRRDGGWANVESGCFHLENSWAAFVTLESAEAAIEADRIHTKEDTHNGE